MVRPWLLLAGLVCLLPAAVAAKEHEVCKLPPVWKVNGLDPMGKARRAGNMTVVALLKGNCAYCLLQARLLQRMKKLLERKGLKGITYMIVNMKEAVYSKYRLDQLVDFAVHQDKDGDILKSLGGVKDDVFVYDRCGRLSYHVDSTISYLGWPHVSNAVLYTHQNKHGCQGACPTGEPASEKNSSSEEGKASL